MNSTLIHHHYPQYAMAPAEPSETVLPSIERDWRWRRWGARKDAGEEESAGGDFSRQCYICREDGVRGM